MLEDEGLVQSTEVDGSRTYTLTESGREEAQRAAAAPRQGMAEGEDQIVSLRLAVGQLVSAAKQLSGAGERSQLERGVAVIQKARKELYQILAED
jgi:DNA-binding PadR family transcriptional regulator